MPNLSIFERVLYVGNENDYSKALCAEMNELCGARFRYAQEYEQVLEECYDYTPTSIVLNIDNESFSLPDKLIVIKAFNRSVRVVISTPLVCARMDQSTRAKFDGVILFGDTPHADAVKIINIMRRNMRFGINLKSVATRVPIVTEDEWHDPSRDAYYGSEAISKILSDLGIPSKVLGHKYLIVAIAIQSATMEAPCPKKLYTDVADYFDTTSAAVEKAIRYAIEKAWVDGDINFQHAIFGFSVDASRGKPTNAELIARIAMELYPLRI